MDFLKKFFSVATAKPEKRYYTFQVKCNRCGDIIEGRVDPDNDLSAEFESDRRTTSNVHKGLMGSGRYFQQIEVEMKFSSTRTLLDQKIQGGTFVE